MKETRHHDDFAGEDLSFFLRLGEDGAGEISMADGDLVAGVLLANRFAAAFITPHEVINDYGETTDQP